MLIRLIRRCRESGKQDYGLVDVLRAMSVYNRECVLTRSWALAELYLWTYLDGGFGPKAVRLMFPDVANFQVEAPLVVSGERLLERSAVVHQFECGLFLRVADPALGVKILPDLRLRSGPNAFQATNVDLEVRCGEAAPYEIVSDDRDLLEHLSDTFGESDIE